jgi:hypothetical protein
MGRWSLVCDYVVRAADETVFSGVSWLIEQFTYT